MESTSTIFSPDEYKQIMENYSSIIEKTNNQLGLSLNVSVWIISILSIFISLLAIAVAFYIFKNSKEEKDRQKTFFDEQEKLIKEKNEKDEKLRKENSEAFDKLIEEQRIKLKSATAEAKNKIEDKIEELNIQKIYSSSPNVLSTEIPITGNIIGMVRCPYCMKEFYNGIMSSINLQSFNLQPTKTICPYCKKVF